MNDMDDSGPCPIVLDLFRLMVSSHLYDANISLESIVSNYLDGLNGKNHKYSDAVTNMLDKSKSRGIEMDPSELENGRFKRDASTQEVGPAISGQISQILTGLGSVLASHASIQDVYQTAKVGGGSGGMARYEVLINDGGKLLYIELKEETTPSIYPVATEPIPPVQQRIFNTLNADQSGRESAFYGVVFVNNKNMLMRPKFPGEIGVNLAKQSKSENKNIIDDEAYILGSIHAATVSHDKKYAADVANIKKSDWKHDVDLMADFFSSKYKSLKSQ
jgi:hypothetical protein